MGRRLEDAQRRILVCMGAACRGKGAGRVRRAVARRLKEQSLSGALITTGCVRLCARAPNVVLYPEGAWFSRMNPERIRKVLDGDAAVRAAFCTFSLTSVPETES